MLRWTDVQLAEYQGRRKATEAEAPARPKYRII